MQPTGGRRGGGARLALLVAVSAAATRPCHSASLRRDPDDVPGALRATALPHHSSQSADSAAGSASSDGGDGGFASVAAPEHASAEAAIRRVEAVEDARSSVVLCRLSGDDGQSSVTVRLQPTTNTRSLVFNEDVSGVETRAQCRGAPPPECLVGSGASSVKEVSSCMQCGCPESAGHVYGSYANQMAEDIDRRCESKRSGDDPLRVLLVGLGCGELAVHLAQRCGSNLDLETVEYDGRLPELAQRYFGLPASVKVTVGDALPVAASLRQAVEEDKLLADKRRYDVILVDCFSTGGVTPDHCRSGEFLETVRALLRSGGSVMQHLWHQDAQHPQVASDYAATVETYKKTFACKGCTLSTRALEGGPDSIVSATWPSSAEQED